MDKKVIKWPSGQIKFKPENGPSLIATGDTHMKDHEKSGFFYS